MTIEKLIKDIMAECEKDGEPVTEDEAREMAEMELKSNETRRYETSDKTKKKSSTKRKERKVDETKKYILSECNDLLLALGADVTAIKTETEITFIFEENEYSLKLIKHRPQKGSK